MNKLYKALDTIGTVFAMGLIFLLPVMLAFVAWGLGI